MTTFMLQLRLLRPVLRRSAGYPLCRFAGRPVATRDLYCRRPLPADLLSNDAPRRLDTRRLPA